MRAFGRKLLLPLLICAIGLLAWRFWPRQAPPPAPIAIAPAPRHPVPGTSKPMALSATVAATVTTSTRAVEPSDEDILRQLAPLSVSDQPRALELALAADSKLPPDGVFAEARRALIVTLLVDVQRMSEARARARRFMTDYPSSSYLPLVQGVTGIHPRPSPSQLRDAQGLAR